MVKRTIVIVEVVTTLSSGEEFDCIRSLQTRRTNSISGAGSIGEVFKAITTIGIKIGAAGKRSLNIEEETHVRVEHEARAAIVVLITPSPVLRKSGIVLVAWNPRTAEDLFVVPLVKRH